MPGVATRRAIVLCVIMDHVKHVRYSSFLSQQLLLLKLRDSNHIKALLLREHGWACMNHQTNTTTVHVRGYQRHGSVVDLGLFWYLR